jgi:hypothetical protein
MVDVLAGEGLCRLALNSASDPNEDIRPARELRWLDARI